MENNPDTKDQNLVKLNGSYGKFQFLILPATKEISMLGWRLFEFSIVLLILIDVFFVVFCALDSSFKGTVSAYVGLVIFFLVTAPVLIVLLCAFYIIIYNKIAPQILLCEPSFLKLNDDFLQLDFTLSEIFGLTNLRRNGGRSRMQSLSFVDYDYVNYSYVIYKNELKNAVIKNHLCTISGNSFLYLPKCFYDDADCKIDPYHIAMHDKYLSDEDRENRDSQYPWIIKKNNLSFVFAFEEKEAEQTLLEWAGEARVQETIFDKSEKNKSDIHMHKFRNRRC